MNQGRSFAFENNMYEESNFLWLKDTQQKDGYRIEMYYIGVEDLKITTKRIQERLKSGDHFVPADQVAEQFEKGMKLLEQYYDMPDTLTLIDNTTDPFECYTLKKGQTIFQSETLPGWAKAFAEAVAEKNTLSEAVKPDEIKQSPSDDLIKAKQQEQGSKLIEKKINTKRRGQQPY